MLFGAASVSLLIVCCYMIYRDKVQISPHEMTTCEDTTQRMFCQLLCGLLQRENVSRLDAPFASSFLKVIKFLEDHWNELQH